MGAAVLGQLVDMELLCRQTTLWSGTLFRLYVFWNGTMSGGQAKCLETICIFPYSIKIFVGVILYNAFSPDHLGKRQVWLSAFVLELSFLIHYGRS